MLLNPRPTARIQKRLFSRPFEKEKNGDERARTVNLLRARQALSQLSYVPVLGVLYHFEPAGQARNGWPPGPNGRTKIRTWDLIVISDAL